MENTKKFADTAQYIVISMGDEQFGIDIKYIDNIVKLFSNLMDTGIEEVKVMQKCGYLIKAKDKKILNELVSKIRKIEK